MVIHSRLKDRVKIGKRALGAGLLGNEKGRTVVRPFQYAQKI
jgi:hypothetical protein